MAAAVERSAATRRRRIIPQPALHDWIYKNRVSLRHLCNFSNVYRLPRLASLLQHGMQASQPLKKLHKSGSCQGFLTDPRTHLPKYNKAPAGSHLRPGHKSSILLYFYLDCHFLCQRVVARITGSRDLDFDFVCSLLEALLDSDLTARRYLEVFLEFTL